MKRVFFMAAIWLGLCASVQAADNVDSGKILALENAWNQAQLHHDANALSQLLPATFVYTDYDGTVEDKAQFRSARNSRLLADGGKSSIAHLTDAHNRILLTSTQISPYNNAAVVTGTYHTKGKYKGKPFEHWGRFTDMWVFQDGTWQCVASHTNLIKK